MTKKKPKISYRDLLATTPETVPVVPVVPVVPSPVDLAVVLNPGVTHQLTPASGVHIVIPQPIAPPHVVSPVSPAAPAPVVLPPRARPTRATRALRATIAGHAIGGLLLRDALAERGHAELLRFRIGSERFALRLAEVEEAVESPELHPLPEMRRDLLGVCALRGRLVPVYAATQPLGVRLDTPGIALVLAGLVRPIAIAVDDVEDVFTLTAAALRPAPGTEDPDGVLVGVTRHNGRLVSVLDGAALAAACLADLVLETP